MATAGKRPWFRCDICGERIGVWSQSAHKLSAHPEVFASQRSNQRLYARKYLPALLAALAFAFGSMFLHAWWWRFGFLSGIYAIVGIVFLFGVRSWRLERPVRLEVNVACMVCGSRMAAREMKGHMSSAHPAVFRAMKRSAWLMTPTLLVFLGYILLLIGLLVLDLLPSYIVLLIPLLLFGPLFTWAFVVAVVGLVLGRRYLKRA